MRIGIDISQLAYPNTGVANYLESLVTEMLKIDKKNEYILFFSSLRGRIQSKKLIDQCSASKVKIKRLKFPPSVLNLLWNKLHIIPIEAFIGKVDVFITSDWTEPPARRAMKATILYDLIVYKYPRGTADKIVRIQKQKLKWVKKESRVIFCISKSTAKDAEELLGIEKSRLNILYPGL